MAKLFDTERSVVTKHLNNIFTSGEVERESNVPKMHITGSSRPIAFYALDAVISVGYRVNSKRGMQFRVWASGVLRDHLVRGYTVNQKRLRDLYQAVRLITQTAARKELGGDEARALLAVVGEGMQREQALRGALWLTPPSSESPPFSPRALAP
jgi:hypothetical protein